MELKRILGRIRCLFGRHERSRSKAREQGKHWVSVCMYCGVPMRQGARRKWYVDRGAR